MPTTLRNTDILFNDGTTQSTAATAASTAFGAIGTYAVLMMAANTNLATGSTIAGSSLRYDFTANAAYEYLDTFANSAPFLSRRLQTSSSYAGGGTSLSGTWRKMSSGVTYGSVTNCGLTSYGFWEALYVRIS